MAHFVKGMCETHNLGASTREWLTAGRRNAGFGNTHARYAGFTEAGPGYAFVRHDPAFAMILIGEKGEGIVSLGHTWAPCPPGHAYITSPRFPHAYHIKPGSRWRLHWVVYWEDGHLPGLSRATEPRLVPVDALGFRHAVEGLYSAHSAKADAIEQGLWSTLVDRNALRMIGSDEGDPRLGHLWMEVRADLGGVWSLGRMAACAGMSEENLRRLCRQELGRSPIAQLTQLRMLQAADLLKLSDEKLASIAARFGYADSFSFSTAFKRTLGKAPSFFRRAGPQQPD